MTKIGLNYYYLRKVGIKRMVVLSAQQPMLHAAGEGAGFQCGHPGFKSLSGH